MRHSCIRLFMHLVWSTKRRLPYFDPEHKKQLYLYIRKLIYRENTELIAIGGTRDHIHILINMNTKTTLSRFVSTIKSQSSKFMNENFEDLRPFSWQEGYGAFSVEYTNVKNKIRYINNQEEHHKRMNFEEELKIL